MFEQDLSDSFVWQSNSSDSGDLITGFASFDYGLGLDTGPGVVIKRAYDLPNFVCGMVENRAVIRFCHLQVSTAADGEQSDSCSQTRNAERKSGSSSHPSVYLANTEAFTLPPR
jgi:hypothetical protein